MATTIEQLKGAKATWEFKAPPFANGTELVVELREPSLSTMIYGDGVSNPLLNDIDTLMKQAETKKKTVPTQEQTRSAFKFITSVVNYCMVSPTMAEVDEYAGGLSINQMMAIYEEVMKSTVDLSSFRTETTDN